MRKQSNETGNCIPQSPVNTTLPYLKPFFRNDDVAVDSHLEHFRQFCEVFHKYGFTQVHGIMLRGLGNVEHMTDGIAVSYAENASISTLPNARIRELSEPYNIADNPKLIAYLNSIPDELALHGLYHTDYSTMSYDEQLADMRQGLAEMHNLFPDKRIRYFIAPFNRHNENTHRVAQELHLRVLYDDGVHLESEFHRLVLEPGIWYRYHHHRFYPESCYTQKFPLSIQALNTVLADALAEKTQGYLPSPAEELDIDIALYAQLAQQHNAQTWYLNCALGRRSRHELQLMAQWVYAHIRRDQSIFEVCCGGGNNLLWLAQHGYTNLHGSDKDAGAVALANKYFAAYGMPDVAHVADFLDTSSFQQPIDVFWASDCLYLIPDFSLNTFLKTLTPHLSQHGCFILDLVDQRYNRHPSNIWHSADWEKEEAERRPSEYKHRFNQADVKNIAQSVGLHIVSAMELQQTIPRTVFVLALENVFFETRLEESLNNINFLNIFQAIHTSGQFDREWYIEQYVRGPLIMEPLEHYIRFGAKKGYNPNPRFDTVAYRKKFMHERDTTNPLLHSVLNNNFK